MWPHCRQHFKASNNCIEFRRNQFRLCDCCVAFVETQQELRGTRCICFSYPVMHRESQLKSHTHVNTRLGNSDNVLWWRQIGRDIADKHSRPCVHTPVGHSFCKHTSVLQTQTVSVRMRIFIQPYFFLIITCADLFNQNVVIQLILINSGELIALMSPYSQIILWVYFFKIHQLEFYFLHWD